LIGVLAEIWGWRSRKTGGLSPLPKHFRWHSVSEKYFVPRLVGASLPYDPRKVVWVGVEWLPSQMVQVVSLAGRSL